MKWARRIVAGIAVLVLLLGAAGWFVLSSEAFRSTRVDFVETELSKALDRPIEIEGDVSISYWPRVALIASNLRLPARDYSNPDIAYLESARFALAPLRRLHGGIPLPEIEARGLKIFVILHSEEIRVPLGSDEPDAAPETAEIAAPDSVAPPDKPDATPAQRQHFDLVTFLGQRKVDFSDAALWIGNKTTGFEFDFKLGDLSIDQVDGGTKAVVSTNGSVNGETFEAGGSFPDAGPYDVSGSFAGVRFTLDGETSADDPEGEFNGDLKIETSDLQGLLDSLKLRGTVSGSGKLHSRLSHSNGRYSFEDLNLELAFDKGKGVVLSGLFRQQEVGADIDLMLDIDLAGDDAGPERAVYLKDIRPLRLVAHIVGEGGEIELRDLNLMTNAGDEALEELGPFRVGKLVRTEKGELQLQDLELNIGPKDAPYLSARGDVQDLIEFAGYELVGRLDLPFERILTDLNPETASQFGRLQGDVHLHEVDGSAVLSELKVQSSDTDLWSGSLDFSVGDIRDLEEVILSLGISLPDSATVFETFGLDPPGKGPFGLSLNADSDGREINLAGSVTVEQSTIGAMFNNRTLNGAPTLRGKIESDEVRIRDVQHAILGIREIASAFKAYKTRRKEADAASDSDVQPLVLPQTSQASAVDNDRSDYQPLVVEAEQDDSSAAVLDEDLSGFQPLVLTEDIGELTLEEIQNPKELARKTDIEVGIDIRKISGQKGISRIKSDLEVKEGQMRFGPLRIDYAGGYANLNAGLNFVETPDWLRISGQTGGWNVGEILESLDAGIGAYGILTGNFDVSGQYKSVRGYVDTMRGQATIKLNDGRISTSLIDLAGLGVVPWLFSRELRQGYADVVCIRAPLKFNNGRIETKATVLETERVQLVAAGYADLNSEQVALRAEPRPVGRPLARSAWPFEVSGSLKDPKLSIGPRKKRTARVPLTMAQNRTPCVPDVGQLQSPDDGLRGGGRR